VNLIQSFSSHHKAFFSKRIRQSFRKGEERERRERERREKRREKRKEKNEERRERERERREKREKRKEKREKRKEKREKRKEKREEKREREREKKLDDFVSAAGGQKPSRKIHGLDAADMGGIEKDHPHLSLI